MSGLSLHVCFAGSNSVKMQRGTVVLIANGLKRRLRGAVLRPMLQSLLLLSGMLFLFAGVVCGQDSYPAGSSDAMLRQHYDAAERFQSSGDMAQADLQFRLFVADALHRVADDRTHIGEYERAAPLFERA